MSLVELLTARRRAVLDAWRERVRATYPEPTRAFLARGGDPFANPVGHALLAGTAALFDGLVRGADPAELAGALDEIVRIRAIQEFTAARAVGFVFFLKDAARGAVKAAEGRPEEWRAWEDRVDALALLAFDRYARFREEVWRLKAAEARRLAGRIEEPGTEEP